MTTPAPITYFQESSIHGQPCFLFTHTLYSYGVLSSELCWGKSQTLFCFCFCCSAAELCLTLWDPMDCSAPGFSVHHYLPEFAQIHVHWVSDTIQPSHLLSPPSPLALNLSQHQSHGREFWQNVVYWTMKQQTASVFLPQEPHEHNEKGQGIN